MTEFKQARFWRLYLQDLYVAWSKGRMAWITETRGEFPDEALT